WTSWCCAICSSSNRASTSRCAVTPTRCRSKSSSGADLCRSRSCSADCELADGISRFSLAVRLVAWHPCPLHRGCPMCRNIRTLHNFEPPATDEEIRASALQFVRKLSGFTRPSKANEAAFSRAVEQVAQAAHELLDALVTSAPPRDREVEAAKARAPGRGWFGRLAAPGDPRRDPGGEGIRHSPLPVGPRSSRARRHAEGMIGIRHQPQRGALAEPRHQRLKQSEIGELVAAPLQK